MNKTMEGGLHGPFGRLFANFLLNLPGPTRLRVQRFRFTPDHRRGRRPAAHKESASPLLFLQ